MVVCCLLLVVQYARFLCLLIACGSLFGVRCLLFVVGCSLLSIDVFSVKCVLVVVAS